MDDTIMSREAYAETVPFPIGAPNEAYAEYFVGQSYLLRLTQEVVGCAHVTFEPGCRNNWHIHHAKQGGGQVLLCTGGKGWYQEWGQDARPLKAGDAVTIPAGIKHWHGAARDHWFSHISIEAPGEDTSNEWLEPVAAEAYAELK